MALNINTDPQFDQALDWIAKKEGKTKSDIVRDLVLERYMAKRMAFRFGALSHIAKGRASSKSIQKELKDLDHDLD